MLLCNLSFHRRAGGSAADRSYCAGIPYPTGDPSLSAEEEQEPGVAGSLQRALEALQTAVHHPTVFQVGPAVEAVPEAEEAHA